MDIEGIIKRLREQDRTAQKQLYERYSPLMFSVCRRYLRSREDAEEALISGFFKVFAQIDGLFCFGRPVRHLCELCVFNRLNSIG